MSYQIHDRGDGQFELVEMRPTVVGILSDRRIAERFADFLDAADAAELAQLAEIERFGAREPFPAPDDARETVFVAGDIPALEDPEPAPEGVEIASVTPAAPAGAGDDVRETPLQEALRRLRAGEQMCVVADETGIPLPKLRGTWAQRARKSRGTAPVTVADAACTTCGRAYHAGASDEGLCARCTRDLGRD